MEISVKFTPQELVTLSRALNFGAMHTIDEKESERMRMMKNKIGLLGQAVVGCSAKDNVL